MSDETGFPEGRPRRAAGGGQPTISPGAPTRRHLAPTLQAALDDWERIAPQLELLATDLEHGVIPRERFHEREADAPLPRAYQWADGSAYVNHVELVRKARGAEMPESFWTDPLMYQGGSDEMLAPRDPIPLADEAWGCDLEAEIVVVTDDVPRGVSPRGGARPHQAGRAGQRRLACAT